VVEADEDVRDDEQALGKAAAGVRQRDRRLERRRVVVAQVADDRLGARRRLVEGDQSRAGAEQRVAPEPPLLDRLEQEARPPGLAHAEVGPEGRDQVGGDNGLNNQKKTLLGSSRRNGIRVRLTSAQAPAPLARARPRTR
jgi:hypothetical protein